MRRFVDLAVFMLLASGIVTWRYDLRAATATFTHVATRLSQPIHEQSFPDASVPDEPAPYWDRGYLIAHVRDSTRPDLPNVTLYDSTGAKVREARIWFPGALHVELSSVTVTTNGNIIAAGYASKVDGSMAFCTEQPDSVCFTFIVKTDLSGKVERVFRTGDFSAGSVCAASDGTVWALGGDPEKDMAQQDYYALRNYSFTSGLLHEHLLRHTLRKPVETGGAGAYLRCTSDAVVLYRVQAKEYIQLDQRNAGANSIDRWDVDAPGFEKGKPMISGFAATDSGHVFASFLKWSDKGDLDSTALYELTVENPEKKLLHWSLVNGTGFDRSAAGGNPAPAVFFLKGTDGSHLVYEGIFDGADRSSLSWSSPIF